MEVKIFQSKIDLRPAGTLHNNRAVASWFDLSEKVVQGILSKDSKYRKTVFGYPLSGDTSVNHQILQRLNIEFTGMYPQASPG